MALSGRAEASAVTSAIGVKADIKCSTLGTDGVSWIALVNPITAAAFVNCDLPPGQYRIAVFTANGVHASLTSVPL